MDFRKMFDSVGATFNRVIQLTEEKVGIAEKTEHDPQFLNLCQRAEQTQKWTEKILKGVEAMLQPNPALRMEAFVKDKLDLEKMKKERVTLTDELGLAMVEAGNEFGAESTYSQALIKCGQAELKVGLAEKSFISRVGLDFLLPLRRFLDEDMKNIEKERKLLENNRLDLDAAKLKAKRVKTEQGKNEATATSDTKSSSETVTKAESDLQAAQSAFDKQLEVTKLQLEKVGGAYTHHMQCLNNLIDCQMQYYAQCHQLMQELQRDLGKS